MSLEFLEDNPTTKASDKLFFHLTDRPSPKKIRFKLDKEHKRLTNHLDAYVKSTPPRFRPKAKKPQLHLLTTRYDGMGYNPQPLSATKSSQKSPGKHSRYLFDQREGLTTATQSSRNLTLQRCETSSASFRANRLRDISAYKSQCEKSSNTGRDIATPTTNRTNISPIPIKLIERSTRRNSKDPMTPFSALQPREKSAATTARRHRTDQSMDHTFSNFDMAVPTLAKQGNY